MRASLKILIVVAAIVLGIIIFHGIGSRPQIRPTNQLAVQPSTAPKAEERKGVGS